MEVSYITAEERLKENEYDEVKYLTDFSYDTALIGVSDDNRAVYDFDKMIDWLIDTQKFEYEEAKEWIEINTIRALPHFGEGAPIIMYPLND